MVSREIKKPRPATVNLEKRDKGVYITWRFTTRIVENSEGFLDCSIPEFELYFNADSREEVDHKSLTLVKMFFNYYADGRSMNLRNLGTALVRLGFRPTNGLADTSKLARNKFVPTKFKSPIVSNLPGVEERQLEDELVA